MHTRALVREMDMHTLQHSAGWFIKWRRYEQTKTNEMKKKKKE